MDVRAKQRLSLLACLFTLRLREFGFAPRHLNRWAALLEIEQRFLVDKILRVAFFVYLFRNVKSNNAKDGA